TDGNLDIAVGADAGITLLLGNGLGGFAVGNAVLTGSAAQSSLAAGDFNNDGTLDLARVGDIGDIVTIYLGDGAGRFSAPSTSVIIGSGGSPSQSPLPPLLAGACFHYDRPPP